MPLGVHQHPMHFELSRFATERHSNAKKKAPSFENPYDCGWRSKASTLNAPILVLPPTEIRSTHASQTIKQLP